MPAKIFRIVKTAFSITAPLKQWVSNVNKKAEREVLYPSFRFFICVLRLESASRMRTDIGNHTIVGFERVYFTKLTFREKSDIL